MARMTGGMVVLMGASWLGACADEAAPRDNEAPVLQEQATAPPARETTAEPASKPTEAALERFWTTFLAGDLDRLAVAQADLLAAQKLDAAEPRLPLVLGMSFVWGNAENDRKDRATEPFKFPEMIANAQSTLAHLTKLTELAPEDPRSWAHLGTAMVTLGLASGNAAMVEQGTKHVEEKTLPRERAEAGFALGAAYSQAAAGSDAFARSIEYYFMAFEDCLGAKLDRDAPSFDAFDAKRTSERPRDVCFNQPHWPHAEEGNFLVFGDALAKAGKLEAAKRAYAAAKAVPDYGSWRYRDVLEARDAATRKSTDPVGAAPANCGQCHAAR